MSHYPAARRRPVTALFLALALLVALPLAPAAAQSAPPAPLTPAEGDTVYPSETTPLAIPEFQWSPIEGTRTYRLQVSRDNFSSMALNVTTANTAYTPPDATPFTDGTWAWRVRADSPSPAGDWSATREFHVQWATATNVPALLEPPREDPPVILAFFERNTFSWQPVLGAASYRLEIATSEDGFSTAKTFTTLNTTLQPTAKLANGAYWWRVVPLDPDNRPGLPSEVRPFIVDYNLAPALIAPADDSTPTFTPTFGWEAVRGAEYYTLQYSTDPTFSTDVTSLTTRNTAYTPVKDLRNDVNFFWRVRAHSGGSVGPWSHPAGEEWSFVKRWYLQPVLLTPTNGFQHVDKPLFSWTPVPGASRYKFELNNANQFPGGYSADTANPFFHVPVGKKSLTPGEDWYWRVTPFDASGNSGQPSAVFSFKTSLLPGPMLISPLYYYPPNDYGDGTEMYPHEDRTAALPIFSWHRAPGPDGQAAAYRIEVSTTDDLNPDGTLANVVWSAETENLFAAPTLDNPFTPAEGTDHFWHVAILDGLGGGLVSPWSEIWVARFAPSAALAPSAAGTTPQILRPAQGSEWTEATPLFEWRPVEGADSYEVEISTDPAFGAAYLVDSASVPYPVYSPTERLTYEGDGSTDLPYGTYYWRVRAVASGSPGNWNVPPAPGMEPARFQVAAQSRWNAERTIADPTNQVLIATDPAGDAAAGQDLTTLHAAQGPNDWFFGLHVAADPGTHYALYLDLDHAYGSGGDADPLGNAVTSIAAHRPEYVIHIGNAGGDPVATSTWIYRWTGSSWATRQNLSTVGGDLSYAEGYLEIRVPNTAIGMEQRTHSAALALYSAPAAGGAPLDTVPPAADPALLTRFASVSDRLVLVEPANLNRAAAEGVRYPTVPPLRWQPPVNVDCYGYYVHAALDVQFTSSVLDYSFRTTNAPGFEPPFLPYTKDLNGDNTYFWRVQPYYQDTVRNTAVLGAFSEPFILERDGLVPTGLQGSVTFATPTFNWDRLEGASGYDLQVSTDPLFGSTVINVSKLARNTYTWTKTLANDTTYYWRVRARRHGSIINDWSPSVTLVLSLPRPSDLTALPSDTPARAPTLCWNPVVETTAGDVPVLAAWKYRVQVSRDEEFSAIWDTVDTEQACWTPTKGYHDGAHWWRVAMIDGQGKIGAYSDPAVFHKAYPQPPLTGPEPGAVTPATPTFSWQPVYGAAKYTLEVSKTADFVAMYDSVTTNHVSYTPTKAYDENTTYYWRVVMIDKDGRVGTGEVRTVTVNPAPGPVDPENGVWLPMLSRG